MALVVYMAQKTVPNSPVERPTFSPPLVESPPITGTGDSGNPTPFHPPVECTSKWSVSTSSFSSSFSWNKEMGSRMNRWARCLASSSSMSETTQPPGVTNHFMRQNDCHFADDIFKCIFLSQNSCISIKISLKFVPKGPIDNIPALFQIMAYHWPGAKPLSEPMMA